MVGDILFFLEASTGLYEQIFDGTRAFGCLTPWAVVDDGARRPVQDSVI